MALVLDGSLGITTNAGTLISASTIGVGGATPSTSGAGITFPATQSASTDANTLDDYEEGTFTPVDGSGAGLTLTVNAATYTKVGNMVTVFMDISYPTNSNSTGPVMSGLPFTVGNSGAGAFCVGYNTYGALNTWWIGGGSTSIYNYGLTNANLSGKRMIGFGSYRV